MSKIKNSVWSIFGKGVKLYFTNFGSFFKYMAFPVLGQILGIILIFLSSFLYAQNLPTWIVEGGLFDNFSMIFLVLFIVIAPGVLIFAKAFWDYLVAYGAINSMLENLLKSGRVYDFPAHTEVITRRTAPFVGLWLLVGVIALVGSFPLLWVIAGILCVYFVLVFQVFAFEPDKSPVECFEKSMLIIKGNFARTLGLMFLLLILTYWALPGMVEAVFEFINLVGFLAIPLAVWAKELPISEMNHLLIQSPFAFQLTSLMIAKSIVSFFLSYIVICFTLPLRSLCMALWYKNLNKGEMKLDKKILDRATKGE